MDSDVVLENSELQQRFEVVAFVLEVVVEFGELKKLVEDFVDERLYAVRVMP